MIEVIKIKTKGNSDLIDITERIAEIVKKSEKFEGIVNVFVKHTTAGIFLIENEKGILTDFKNLFEKIVPKNQEYAHNRFGENNAHSHLKSSMLGFSLSIPFFEKEILLGTWQRIFLVDFDRFPREREIVVSVY